jgi:hypothetical protein
MSEDCSLTQDPYDVSGSSYRDDDFLNSDYDTDLFGPEDDKNENENERENSLIEKDRQEDRQKDKKIIDSESEITFLNLKLKLIAKESKQQYSEVSMIIVV